MTAIHFHNIKWETAFLPKEGTIEVDPSFLDYEDAENEMGEMLATLYGEHPKAFQYSVEG